MVRWIGMKATYALHGCSNHLHIANTCDVSSNGRSKQVLQPNIVASRSGASQPGPCSPAMSSLGLHTNPFASGILHELVGLPVESKPRSQLPHLSPLPSQDRARRVSDVNRSINQQEAMSSTAGNASKAESIGTCQQSSETPENLIT